MADTIIISLFQYQGLKNKWQAFGRMGRSPLLEQEVPGLRFWRPFGTGGGNGFSIRPDFSTYGLLTVFDTEATAMAFTQSTTFGAYQASAIQYTNLYLHTAQVHGEWGGSNPFEVTTKLDQERPICVITRATIKPSLALKFWQYVPSVSASMDDFPGLIFSKGIGEWPIFMQATFSYWENAKAMKAYAYQNPKHHEMV
ncbi:MAG: hypothetical protein AAFP96_07505, partial [Bacteroidota bacterium]